MTHKRKRLPFNDDLLSAERQLASIDDFTKLSPARRQGLIKGLDVYMVHAAAIAWFSDASRASVYTGSTTSISRMISQPARYASTAMQVHMLLHVREGVRQHAFRDQLRELIDKIKWSDGVNITQRILEFSRQYVPADKRVKFRRVMSDFAGRYARWEQRDKNQYVIPEDFTYPYTPRALRDHIALDGQDGDPREAVTRGYRFDQNAYFLEMHGISKQPEMDIHDLTDEFLDPAVPLKAFPGFSSAEKEPFKQPARPAQNKKQRYVRQNHLARNR